MAKPAPSAQEPPIKCPLIKGNNFTNNKQNYGAAHVPLPAWGIASQHDFSVKTICIDGKHGDTLLFLSYGQEKWYTTIFMWSKVFYKRVWGHARHGSYVVVGRGVVNDRPMVDVFSLRWLHWWQPWQLLGHVIVGWGLATFWQCFSLQPTWTIPCRPHYRWKLWPYHDHLMITGHQAFNSRQFMAMPWLMRVWIEIECNCCDAAWTWWMGYEDICQNCCWFDLLHY